MPTERIHSRRNPATDLRSSVSLNSTSNIRNATSMPETTEPTFEESLTELQRIVAELEQGDLGLTDSLSRYEEGICRLKQCYQHLEAAERRMELLRGVDEDGQAVTESFEEAEMTLEEKAAARGNRRSRPRNDL